ncbi:transcription elongation factor [Suillus subalutaceus]|uniref:transcription elongation factor n=1 Tax=Suillus subalutaceus TaxID=48586 RepID=UPI001B86BF89|nr:transcription elongation factor [Suillus subalutaceus]KAG1856981.1 transcription elongation factor [Suillus subalutaceus]
MSEAAAELKKLVKQLQNTSTEVVGIRARIFPESKAGLAVGKLRTHEAKEVSDLAREIVKKWKNEVERAKGGSGSKAGTPANGKAAPTRKGSASVTPSNTATPAPVNGKLEPRSAKADGVKASGTGDNTRDRCTELIYDGLACDSGAPSELILSRAKAVEAAVTNAAYKGKIRSSYVNLKDKGNPSLRENIVSGDLSAEKFSKMTSEEMSSEERRAADQKIKEDNFFKSLGAGEREAETEGFQCSRCKQRKCRYRQAQTRSADEPMTVNILTFRLVYRCVNCGNKWKFS